MLGTQSPEQKRDWKTCAPALAHAYNFTKMQPMDITLLSCLMGRNLDSPVALNFGLQKDDQDLPPNKSHHVEQHRRLKNAHRREKQLASKNRKSIRDYMTRGTWELS